MTRRTPFYVIKEESFKKNMAHDLGRIYKECGSKEAYKLILEFIRDGKFRYAKIQRAKKWEISFQATQDEVTALSALSVKLQQMIVQLLFENDEMVHQYHSNLAANNKPIMIRLRNEAIEAELKKLKPLENANTQLAFSHCKAVIGFVLVIGTAICLDILSSMSTQRAMDR